MTSPGGPNGTPAEPHPVLGQLAAELHGRGWPAELICSPGRWPCVLVHGGAPGSICEKVFATENGGLYIPGIRPHLAPKGNVTTAADRLIWILRARALHEHPAEIGLAIDDLTALQRALARLGHHGQVIIPEPYLLLPPGRDGTAPEIHCHLLEFHWAGLPIGRCRHIPATAQIIAWALHAESAALPGPPSSPPRTPPDDPEGGHDTG